MKNHKQTYFMFEMFSKTAQQRRALAQS